MEYAGIPAVMLIMGISEVLKRTGFNAKYIPFINLILGLGAGITLNYPDVTKGIFEGLACGLTASGIFSSVKNVTQEISNRMDNIIK